MPWPKNSNTIRFQGSFAYPQYSGISLQCPNRGELNLDTAFTIILHHIHIARYGLPYYNINKTNQDRQKIGSVPSQTDQD